MWLLSALLKGSSVGGFLETLEIQHLFILFCMLHSRTSHHIEWIHRVMHNHRHYRGCSAVGVSWVPLHVAGVKTCKRLMFVAALIHNSIMGNKEDTGTTKRIQKETNFTLPSEDFREGGGMFIEKVTRGQGQRDMERGCTVGFGEGTYHWSYQGRGALSRCVGVCLHHGSLVSQAEVVDPPTCWLCPCGQYFSEPCTSSPLQRRRMKERHKKTKKKRREWVPRTDSNTITTIIWLWLGGEIHSNLRSHILTLGPFALAGGPQVEQRRALLQQGVRILHADLIDIIHTELKLAC